MRWATLTAALALAAPLPARAQASGGDAALTAKLIQLLIDKGVLTKDQAGSLLQQAQGEARAKPRRGKAVAAAPAAAAGSAAATGASAAEAVPPGTVRVTYVPQIVRDQIAAEVRTQVMQQAEAEHWAAPGALPEWTKRFTLYGDLRIRGERDLFDKNNYNLFPDFNAINNSGGFDLAGSTLPPLLNTTQDRTRFRLRARLGMHAVLDDWISSDIRIATGTDSSPVSTNQTLGQGSNFGKYALWLDQAYVTLQPVKSLKMYVGREPNPFWTSDLLFDPDLNFDGMSAQASLPIRNGLDGFINAGAFPVFNSAFNFSSNQITKFPSHDKYLFAAQGGLDWKINDNYAAKFATGYFSYYNIQGQPSSPCLILTASDACNTDETRPQFGQFGNTLFPIRTLLTNPNNPSGPQPQYFGLASRFGILDLHGQFDIKTFSPIVISLEGDFVKNLSYSRSTVLSRGPVNNLGANNAYQGGDTGYMAKVTVGEPTIGKKWDWNVALAYKYLETDAVLDAFTDSEFHLGGTNAKGFVLNGNLGIANNVWLSAQWYSANQVSGPPYSNDVIQVDLNAKF